MTTLRLIPIIEFADTSVNEFVEGGLGGLYGQTKRHPSGRSSQVFPHPDLESEERLQKWLKAWPKARFDVFSLVRRGATIGVDFVMQRKDGDKWVTLPGMEWEFEDTPGPAVPAPVKRGRGRPRKVKP